MKGSLHLSGCPGIAQQMCHADHHNRPESLMIVHAADDALSWLANHMAFDQSFLEILTWLSAWMR